MVARKKDDGLGFRTLHGFNLAMLGKQGWKLISNPEAMVSRIFKARCFPNDDFFNAKIGYNPSLVWLSICNS